MGYRSVSCTSQVVADRILGAGPTYRLVNFISYAGVRREKGRNRLDWVWRARKKDTVCATFTISASSHENMRGRSVSNTGRQTICSGQYRVLRPVYPVLIWKKVCLRQG